MKFFVNQSNPDVNSNVISLEQQLPNLVDLYSDFGMWLQYGETLYYSGSSSLNECGLGFKMINQDSTFKKVTALQGEIQQIAGGGGHTLILQKDGCLWVFGNNRQGQLGLGYYSESEGKPEPLKKAQINGKVIRVAAGFGFSLVQTEEGLWSTGANNRGYLGLKHNDHVNSFQQVQGLEGEVRLLAAGDSHSLAVIGDDLWVCGNNRHGQLGLGHKHDCNSFQHVAGLQGNILQIAAGDNFSLVLTTEGLFGCGQNDSGQLGIGDNTDDETRNCKEFKKAIGLDGKKILQIDAGHRHSVILTEQEVMVSGSNYSGQLGLGLPCKRECYFDTFQKVESIKANEVLRVKAGFSHTAVLTKYALLTCGGNLHTQLGFKFDADEYYLNTFTKVEALPDVIKDYFSLKPIQKEFKLG